MTIFDYLVLFILICSIVISTLRGLVREVMSLVSWILALIVANIYSENLVKLLPKIIFGNLMRLIVAFLALFIGVRLLMMLLTVALETAIKVSGLRLVDSGLGILFGLARALMMILVAVLICSATTIPQQPFWRDAMLSSLMECAARTVIPYIPYLPSQFASHLKI